MILLDPDLSPALLPAPAARSTAASDRSLRLPTSATLTRFLKLAQQTVKLKGQVTVLFTTDEAIKKLNRQFRGKNKATDVLSFPSEGLMPGLPAHLQMAGDLAISVPTALRQAQEQGHALSVEARVLMLHGLLHLSGMDHETDAGQMARRERQLRARLKLPQGLIERVEAEHGGSAKKATPARKSAAKKAAAKKSSPKTTSSTSAHRKPAPARLKSAGQPRASAPRSGPKAAAPRSGSARSGRGK
jgi:probable rRNA maturation factor